MNGAQKENTPRRNGKKGAIASGIVTNLVFVRAHAGKAVELEGALKKMAQQAHREPGNVAYELHHSASELEEYLVFAIWRSRADLEAYINAPVVQTFFREVPQFVDGAVNLRLFHPVDVA